MKSFLFHIQLSQHTSCCYVCFCAVATVQICDCNAVTFTVCRMYICTIAAVNTNVGNSAVAAAVEKSSDKNGMYAAIEIASIWLEKALKA